MARIAGKEKAILMAAFARIDPLAMTVAFASVSGMVIFAATAVLLIKSMMTSSVTGPHLALLGIYLPGYTVSWPGAFLGAAYFCVFGAVAGFVLATFWNLSHHLYLALIAVRALRWKMMAE
jgi:hypothetical protein